MTKIKLRKMSKTKKLKNFVFSTIVLWVLTPVTAHAINPRFLSKGQTIGEIFRESIFPPLIGPAIYIVFALLLLVPALIIGSYMHRRRIAYLFFKVYPVVFFIPILFKNDAKLSDILWRNIFFFYIAIFFTFMAFFASTQINKHKEDFSKKDYIPLAIIIAITLVLMFLPIESGDLVCNIPIVNKSFNCICY